MRPIDACKLRDAIIEAGQANRRGKYNLGDYWELTFAEIQEVIDNQPTIEPELYGYGVRHLAFVANILKADGVTADNLKQTLSNTSALLRITLKEIQKQAMNTTMHIIMGVEEE